jgi:hypothetical protein
MAETAPANIPPESPAGPPLNAVPLEYFETILKDSPQGTSNATTRFQATHFWWSDPTPRQLEDYDADLAAAARSDDIAMLEQAVGAGKCLSARNRYGESLVHAACYGSAPRALSYILRNGGNLKGCDATGRTPLHYACAARKPCFEIPLQILSREPRQAHAYDSRGKRALSSVPQDNHRLWCVFMHGNRRALRGLASPEPRLVRPRQPVAPPPPPLPQKSPIRSDEASARVIDHGKSPGLCDVSPLLLAVSRVGDEATPAAEPALPMRIDSGAAARAMASLGTFAKGRAASPAPLRTSPATRLRSTVDQSRKHERDAASDEEDPGAKRGDPSPPSSCSPPTWCPRFPGQGDGPSPIVPASPAVRTLDHTPSLRFQAGLPPPSPILEARSAGSPAQRTR